MVLERQMMTIEERLEKQYWVIDILPKQVPVGAKGQYFKVEEYYLQHPQMDVLYKKFVNILLKLNCYEEMNFSSDGETWATNPAPQDIEAMVMKCLASKEMLYVILKPSDAMITIAGDDTYMTVYGPTNVVLKLLGSLATSEGLFVWKPTNVVEEPS